MSCFNAHSVEKINTMKQHRKSMFNNVHSITDYIFIHIDIKKIRAVANVKQNLFFSSRQRRHIFQIGTGSRLVQNNFLFACKIDSPFIIYFYWLSRIELFNLC